LRRSGLGPGAETRGPMADAIIGGLILSTVLSLFVVPAFYVLSDRIKRSLAPCARDPGRAANSRNRADEPLTHTRTRATGRRVLTLEPLYIANPRNLCIANPRNLCGARRFFWL
jgi:hypothetical protein